MSFRSKHSGLAAKSITALALMAAIAIPGVSHSAPMSIGLNPSDPLGGFDMGEGFYATQIGVQSANSLVGSTITSSDLFDTILSGTVNGFYYSDGNAASAMFENIDPFSEFTSDTVITSGDRNNAIWDSLFAVHTNDVVFSNGTGGTNTMGTDGNRRVANPFTDVQEVPEPGTVALLLGGLGILGFMAFRRKNGIRNS